MFAIHCPTCSHKHLVTYRMIEAFENTAVGPVAAVRCNEGHRVLTDFGRSGQGEIAA